MVFHAGADAAPKRVFRRRIGFEMAGLDAMPASRASPSVTMRKWPSDAKHKLIAAEDVTNEGTDYQQLANVALEAKANLELTQAEVVADAGYYNAAEVSRCVNTASRPFIPKSDTSANTARDLYGKSQFKYDATEE
jgi:hypothetical protein